MWKTFVQIAQLWKIWWKSGKWWKTWGKTCGNVEMLKIRWKCGKLC